MEVKKKYVIIVAGGKGERMGSVIPKQFLLLWEKPVLMHTITVFYTYDPSFEILVVLPGDQQETWRNLCEEYRFGIKHRVVSGGETRFHSVKNALSFLPANEHALVGVHDGVRPLVSVDVVSRCYEAADRFQAVVPVVPLQDSIRELDVVSGSSRSVDRQCYRLVQTPQVFQSEVLLKAYKEPYSPQFTDDASVVGRICDIHLVDGNRENIKITTAEDLLIADVLFDRNK